MTKQNKITLKGYFNTGDIPTENNFSDLIDSLMPEGQGSVIVETTNDPLVNGQNLLNAYTMAKSITPNGAVLSANNRVVVIILPGVYDLGEGIDYLPLILDTEFIDIIGLSSIASHQVIKGTPPPLNSGVIVQTANDVEIANCQIRIGNILGVGNEWDYSYSNNDSTAYYPDTNLPLTKLTNIEFYGSDYYTDGFSGFCMRTYTEYSGTYTNVVGLPYKNGTRLGIIFGPDGAVASGTFKRCIGGYMSFSTAPGYFEDCTGEDKVFQIDASGTLIRCNGGNYSFGNSGTEGASGTFIDCIGDSYAFGFNNKCSGIFIRCTGGNSSFGDLGNLSGSLYFCRKESGVFSLDSGGKLRACVDGNDNFISEQDYVA